MRRHDEVRKLYIEQLAHVWVEDSTTEATRASVEKKIDDFVEEGLEHATEMLSALWEIVNKEGDVTAPADASPTVSPFYVYLLSLRMWRYSLRVSRPRRSRAPRTGRL